METEIVITVKNKVIISQTNQLNNSVSSLQLVLSEMNYSLQEFISKQKR